MKPEIGKWYMISYGNKGSYRAYHGKAKCIQESHFDESKSSWCFRFPNEPDHMNYFGYHLFKSCDIKYEVTPEPTYEELKAEVERLREELMNVEEEKD